MDPGVAIEIGKTVTKLTKQAIDAFKTYRDVSSGKNKFPRATASNADLEARLVKTDWESDDASTEEPLVTEIHYNTELVTKKAEDLISQLQSIRGRSKKGHFLNLKCTFRALKSKRRIEEHEREHKSCEDRLAGLRTADTRRRFETFEHQNYHDRILQSLMGSSPCTQGKLISDAAPGTFNWIFDERSQLAWDNFAEWLSSILDTKSRIYWISGKPAAGKSTMMNFICNHDRTLQLLTQWKPLCSPIILWFAYDKTSGSGTLITFNTMLRSLVYQICKRSVENARKIVQLMSMTPPFTPDLWTTTKCIEALTGFIRASTNLKFCFFIDGIDEYGGIPDDIRKLFRLLTQFDSVKVCLSSRPEAWLHDAFGEYPGLELDKWNHDDIFRYVEGHLAEEIAITPWEISERADGVFLWAVVICRAITNDQQSGVESREMRRRFEDAPDELEFLFDSIFSRLDKHNQSQIKLFIDIQKTLSLTTWKSTTGLQNTVAILAAIKYPGQSHDYDAFLDRCKQIAKQVNFLSKGLLETSLDVKIEPEARKQVLRSDGREEWRDPPSKSFISQDTAPKNNGEPYVKSLSKMVSERRRGKWPLSAIGVHARSQQSVRWLHRFVFDYFMNSNSGFGVLSPERETGSFSSCRQILEALLELLATRPTLSVQRSILEILHLTTFTPWPCNSAKWEFLDRVKVVVGAFHHDEFQIVQSIDLSDTSDVFRLWHYTLAKTNLNPIHDYSLPIDYFVKCQPDLEHVMTDLLASDIIYQTLRLQWRCRLPQTTFQEDLSLLGKVLQGMQLFAIYKHHKASPDVLFEQTFDWCGYEHTMPEDYYREMSNAVAYDWPRDVPRRPASYGVALGRLYSAFMVLNALNRVQHCDSTALTSLRQQILEVLQFYRVAIVFKSCWPGDREWLLLLSFKYGMDTLDEYLPIDKVYITCRGRINQNSFGFPASAKKLDSERTFQNTFHTLDQEASDTLKQHLLQGWRIHPKMENNWFMGSVECCRQSEQALINSIRKDSKLSAWTRLYLEAATKRSFMYLW